MKQTILSIASVVAITAFGLTEHLSAQTSKTTGKLVASESIAAVKPLQAHEKLLFVELADDTLRIKPSEASKPVIDQVLSKARVKASVAGRVMKRFWVVNAKDMQHTGDRARVVQQLKADPAVRSVSENKTYRPSAFNDPGYPNQQVLYSGQSQPADLRYDSEFLKLTERTPGANEDAVRVAVLDTGIAPVPDLQGQFDLQANFEEGVQYDFLNDRFTVDNTAFRNATEPAASGPGGTVPFYHGSKVQSLINAKAGNSSGIVGLDRNIEISQIRVLGDTGGSGFNVLLGMLWSVGLYDRYVLEVEKDENYSFFPRLPPTPSTQRANVLNLSLGGDGACSSMEQAAIDFILNNSDALIVAAAGNEALYGDQAVSSSPANCNGVVSVGASTTKFGDTVYSNISPALVTSTLGGDSTVGDNLPVTEPDAMQGSSGFSFASGTSFSTPLVSGVLATALRLGLKQGMTSASIIEALRSTGHEFRDPDSFCVQIADPATNPRPCGTILNTSAFLLAVTGVNISATKPSTPTEPVVTPPDEDITPTQPGTGEDSGLPNQPSDPNPPVSESLQFNATVNNIDSASIMLTPLDANVDPSTYNASFARDTNSIVVNISIPGTYRLSFEADRVSQSTAVQPAAAGQTLFVSDVTLSSGTPRQITASDPMPADANTGGNTGGTPAPAAPSGGGGGGGSTTLPGLLVTGVLLALYRRRFLASYK